MLGNSSVRRIEGCLRGAASKLGASLMSLDRGEDKATVWRIAKGELAAPDANIVYSVVRAPDEGNIITISSVIRRHVFRPIPDPEQAAADRKVTDLNCFILSSKSVACIKDDSRPFPNDTNCNEISAKVEHEWNRLQASTTKALRAIDRDDVMEFRLFKNEAHRGS